jgi:hypothetical protein
MHLFGTCVLAIGIAVFVIIGFVRVARDLLSRSIFGAPSLSNEERAVEIADDRRFASPIKH